MFTNSKRLHPIMSPEEFRKSLIKYPPKTKCIVFKCKNEGLFEGGDARCYCPMCEEHADIKKQYHSYLNSMCYYFDDVSKLSTEELYNFVQKRRKKLENRLEKALNDSEEMSNGRKFGKT